METIVPHFSNKRIEGNDADFGFPDKAPKLPPRIPIRPTVLDVPEKYDFMMEPEITSQEIVEEELTVVAIVKARVQ